jgi:hypothetical protein
MNIHISGIFVEPRVRMSIEASFTELLVPSINGRSSGNRLAGTGSVDRRNNKFRKMLETTELILQLTE